MQDPSICILSIIMKKQLSNNQLLYFQIINVQDNPLRMSTFPLQNICQKCSQVQKRLRIAVSDYEFEIKKIKEDQSTDKAMYEIHLQKEVKRLQELYVKEKSNREDQAKNWLSKYDATVGRYEGIVKGLKEEHDRKITTKVTELKGSQSIKIQNLTDSYENKINELIKKYQDQIKSLKQANEKKVEDLNNQHEQYCSSLKKSHKVVLDQKTKSFESRLLGAQSQKIKESKLHQQTKLQNKQTQSKLYQQIFTLRKQVSQLQSKLSTQIQISMSHCNTISTLKSQISNLNISHASQIIGLQQENEKKLQENRDQYRRKLKILYQDGIAECNKYQAVIQKIQENRENQKMLYLNNIQEVNGFVDSRASRPEDLQEIQGLREGLAKKTKECDLLVEELKFFRLEMQNKEETYNKIFVPITSSNASNQAMMYKRKEFKLRRQGKSVTTVREALQSLSGVNNISTFEKRNVAPLPPKPKLL